MASLKYNDEFEFDEKKFAQNIFAHLDVKKSGRIIFDEFENLSQYFSAILQIIQFNSDGIVSQKNIMDILFETKQISDFGLQTIVRIFIYFEALKFIF